MGYMQQFLMILNQQELTQWIALCVSAKNVTCFASFGVEHIPKEITKFTGNKNTIANICRTQAYDSIKCKQFSTGFVDFILNGKIFLGYASLFSPNHYEKNDKVILKYFQ